jgi:glutamate/tyrosine decarboxylase-like PLP-dependent enzyme
LDSENFLAFIPNAPTSAARAFDAVVSAATPNGISWLEGAAVIEAENQVLDVLTLLAGLPKGAGGCFVSGGSAANLSALATARDLAARRRPEVTRWAVIASDHAHSSITSAVRLLGMDVVTAHDVNGHLAGPAVCSAVTTAQANGQEVCAIVATAGTTNAGLVDDLAGIADVAAARSIWFHVDAAYGGAALFSERARPLFAGLGRADSVTIDPHKWLFAPLDCAALIYARPDLARSVHAQHAEYLEAIHDDEAWNPSDYAFHLTRRARGLPLWYSMAVHGLDAYRRAIEAGLDLAQYAAWVINRLEHLELVVEPSLSVVLFRRRGWSRDDYVRWADTLRAEGVAFVLPSSWDFESVGRLVFVHPGTSTTLVDDILARAAATGPARH